MIPTNSKRVIDHTILVSIMVKAELRYLVDMASLTTFIINAISGYILWFILPPGGFRFLGIDRFDWKTIHDYSGLIFTIAIIIHFIVNIKWIIQMTKKIFMKQ